MLAKKAKDVLLGLQELGILNQLVLIGSWCSHFYKSYFKSGIYNPSIQTLDIDFLISDPRHVKTPNESLPELLKSMDFEIEFTASGWTRFVHPDLRVEFLIPRLGPQSDEPRKVPQFQISAMPLRHTHVLTTHTIKVQSDGIHMILPHPVAFAMHKLLISGKRKDKDKSTRDTAMALRLLEAIRESKMEKDLLKVWGTFTKNEQRDITAILQKNADELTWLISLLTLRN